VLKKCVFDPPGGPPPGRCTVCAAPRPPPPPQRSEVCSRFSLSLLFYKIYYYKIVHYTPLQIEGRIVFSKTILYLRLAGVVRGIKFRGRCLEGRQIAFPTLRWCLYCGALAWDTVDFSKLKIQRNLAWKNKTEVFVCEFP
jgi:hypothetical protein